MHISTSATELKNAFEGGAVESCLEQWEIHRPGQIAEQLTEDTVSLTYEESVDAHAAE